MEIHKYVPQCVPNQGFGDAAELRRPRLQPNGPNRLQAGQRCERRLARGRRTAEALQSLLGPSLLGPGSEGARGAAVPAASAEGPRARSHGRSRRVTATELRGHGRHGISAVGPHRAEGLRARALRGGVGEGYALHSELSSHSRRPSPAGGGAAVWGESK